MSEQNLATARRFVDALARRDYDAAAAEFADEFEIDDTDIPESTGADSFQMWLARWDESWESWRIEDLEMQAVGEDCVLSLFRMVVRGQGSGIELSRDDATVAQFREGKMTRIGYYNDQEQARRAAAELEGRSPS